MSKDNDNVIVVENLVKEYKMFNSKKDRLLESLIPKYKKHGTFRAMNDVSFTVKKGEILGVLGKNGAGKSTLLKMITGVVTPTSGSLKVNGKISSLLELGAAFNPELTGYENIYQHGQVMGLTDAEIKEKENEIIEFADIGEHLSQPVKTYSSGMFARLAFACAINVEPDILIVDEVLSVGDMAFQLKCFKKFDEFKKKGKTILFVTHNISDILRNCTRTIIIDAGTKIFDGSVKDGVELYKKIIVGLNPTEIRKQNKIEKEAEKLTEDTQLKDSQFRIIDDPDNETWKEHMIQNDKLITYGNGKAEVFDYGIFDDKGNYISSIENDKTVYLKSRIKFNDDVDSPVFTMTIKDFKGLEMCGTNTLIENIDTGNCKKGDIVEVTFKQRINLGPGKYTLSFSCTHINTNGELEVLNRKYDALLVEILSTKEVVGFIRLDSEISCSKK